MKLFIIISVMLCFVGAKAQLTVYDLTGKQLKAYTISSRNQTAYTISGTELAPGMYKYALLTDGVLVDTKTMVVTE